MVRRLLNELHAMSVQHFPVFLENLKRQLPAAQLVEDHLSRTAMANDASFYRLIPRLIVVVNDEREMITVITLAACHGIAITFRASGTSLSGQSVTDSVLIKLSPRWSHYLIQNGGLLLTAGVGLLGGEANRYLAPFKRSIAAQPASIAAASIGGIAINNASGMNSLDTYSHVKDMRLLFTDGSILDTANEANRQQFVKQHPDLIGGLTRIRDRINNDAQLSKHIRHKYRIKNTMGYSLRAFLDASDPIDIIKKIMIGSEGTLAFLSQITQHTIAVESFSASALILFDNLDATGQAIQRFKNAGLSIAAAELMDSKALQAAMQRSLPLSTLVYDSTTALLIQINAESNTILQERIKQLNDAIADLPLSAPIQFSQEPDVVANLWKIRKSVLPAVGANRAPNTTTLIEDVCYPVEVLPQALRALRALLDAFHYHDAVIFGHALSGNIHFVFSQGFNSTAASNQYREFMTALAKQVVEEFDGSLKAEHGTGRNMAPFVEYEWGSKAHAIMREIKALFDPHNILNPGVILNDDPHVHLKNIKPMPSVDGTIDPCIECGFCERVCPSQQLSFTPRQRIVARRALGDKTPARRVLNSFQYNADRTCAGCGLCETVCPVEINTGTMIRQWRAEHVKAKPIAQFIANHFSTIAALTHKTWPLIRRFSPLKQPVKARKIRFVERESAVQTDANKSLVPLIYFGSCSGRIFDSQEGPLSLESLTKRLLQHAGFQVITPNNADAMCCGLAFQSKGYFKQSVQKRDELMQGLLALSQNGSIAIYCDASPCSAQLIASAKDRGLHIYDSLDFLAQFVIDKLPLTKLNRSVAIHTTCASQRMNQAALLKQLAARCATTVTEPDNIHCCGFGGDRGLLQPELNASALSTLATQVNDCSAGYSSSMTCEMGLSQHSGIDYQSIIYLLAESAGLITHYTTTSYTA